jgi:hypothetical protein
MRRNCKTPLQNRSSPPNFNATLGARVSQLLRENGLEWRDRGDFRRRVKKKHDGGRGRWTAPIYFEARRLGDGVRWLCYALRQPGHTAGGNVAEAIPTSLALPTLSPMLKRVLVPRPKPLIWPPLKIGHRGEAPENTLASFELALRKGADGIEFDVQLSSDGVPMVIHDARLTRTTSGNGCGRGSDMPALAFHCLLKF